MWQDEQQKTLETPRMQYGLLSRALFLPMDWLYGKAGDLRKFHVLEVVARVPYQAWENVAYVAITHTYAAPRFARRIFEFVEESRRQQDNEQWHLLVLEELIGRRGLEQGFFRYRLVPQLLAFFYYHLSWIVYVLRPSWSYRLNAEFEDHAEHSYMEFVAANPELEDEPHVSEFCEDYGSFDSVADLLRRIALDEREHKQESLARLEAPRFGLTPRIRSGAAAPRSLTIRRSVAMSSTSAGMPHEGIGESSGQVPRRQIDMSGGPFGGG